MLHFVGGAVASWLVCSSLEWVVRVRALAGDIVLCSWERHLTLTVPLSTQVYKWVPINCWGKPNKERGNDLRWTSILSRGSRNTPSRFMLQKPAISCGSYGPLRIERLHFFFHYTLLNYIIFHTYTCRRHPCRDWSCSWDRCFLFLSCNLPKADIAL